MANADTGEAATVNLTGLVGLLVARPAATRTLVAIAGPPGSGKSTTAERVVQKINARAPGRAALVPMDGFHYDDRVLKDLGRHARKGAPDTFDVGGLAALLQRLKANTEDTIAIPVFDRDIEISRGAARLVPHTADLIVVEGNYLLLGRPPWDALLPLFDVTVLIRTAERTLRDRLARRWQGYNLTPEAIRAKLEENDLPNGRVVMDESRGYGHVLRT